jgi:hypothetical protein
MNYTLLDHLEVFTSRDDEKWHDMLVREGVYDQNGMIQANKLNLMTGAFTSSLVNAMREEEMNVIEVYDRFRQLHEKNEVHAMYYLLYLIFATLEIDLPYLFLAVGAEEAVLAGYMDEFLKDYEDCMGNACGR